MKVMVFGVSGMIGNAMLQVLSEQRDWMVIGTVRSDHVKSCFPEPIASRIVSGVDLADHDALVRLFAKQKPDVVVNCAGVTKHVAAGNNPLAAIMLNALAPHRLAELCGMIGARLVQVSTDCVFSGARGGYKETDVADAQDVYGRSKVLGEVSGPGLVTLRTSTIGHELQTRHGLLEWFLSQTRCKGFTRAIFSGLPSVVFARVVRDVVLADKSLSGLYHVAAEPIDKAALLAMIAHAYRRTDIEIVPDDEFVIDRSLDSSLFCSTTGYCAPTWSEMIDTMHDYYARGVTRNV